MRRQRPLRAAVAGLATATAALGLVVTGGGAAHAAPTPLPAHVYAPYFEAYNTAQGPAAAAAASGAKYLTMAFAQTDAAGSCTPYWNGDTSTPFASSAFGSDISAIQAAGGDVIPSFGGYAADHAGTDIADSCTDVSSIAAAYEKAVTTYNITRIDLDTEDNSLTDTAGIDRRNKAIKQVEDWAAANGRTVQFSYTLPTTTGGLAASGLAVLQNAVANDARIDVVNIMTFDYYDGATHEMATDTENAATGLYNQLATLYPSKSAAQLWSTIGVTEMPGVDDFGPAETFTTADGPTVESWAAAKGLASLSMWALQRDNGGCPGSAASDSCSSIAQSTWQFSQDFEPFTSSSGAPASNDFSLSATPAAGSAAPGGTATTTVATHVTAGSAQSVSLKASGAPSGVTLALSPASVTAGASSTLTAKVGSTVAAGSYPVTVTGTAASGSHTATYTLTVTGSGGTGGSGSLVNGGFETGTLSPWTCQSGGAVVSSPAHTGSHALQVVPTSSQTGECDQALTLKANTSYTLSGWVEGSYAYLGVSGGATASSWTSATGWTKLSVPFTTGSTGAVTVYVHGWYAQGDVHADDLAVS
ncbi:glycosyl hydrolase family 18 protein [Streptomyces sp. SL13]|uniref:chitinase n=1 Tax=Streptantibioticus silvisoli TaxID=2705255 RepID=A0AA90HG68_9ACTN|nr:carbohydrate binding domain-containing protein [Streptantibioticus silvisoli]MDI5961810.1 glycosyl hydrolase family 18 protein [Streptantibioticus silvisoli]MDI5974347.1 glycosyl hydrolase family 18 protein [Streptantibioticus silvisoli]